MGRLRKELRGELRAPMGRGRGVHGVTLPRTGLLLLAKTYDADAALILDKYRNHLAVVSGTTWADFVVTVPADPALVTADDGTLFTLGVPNELDATARAAMTGDQFYFHESKGLAVYDAALTGTDLTKALRYFRVPPVNAAFPYTLPFEVA